MRVDIKSYGMKLFWELQVWGHTENILAKIHCLVLNTIHSHADIIMASLGVLA
jgi:hypothetical protein